VRCAFIERAVFVGVQAQKEEGINHIITFCSGMDEMLGGGVALGQVTEFCGVPGASVCQSKVSLVCYIKAPRQLSCVFAQA